MLGKIANSFSHNLQTVSSTKLIFAVIVRETTSKKLSQYKNLKKS